MSDEKLKKSLAPGGVHHLLGRMVGNWKGSAKTWFEPGKLADESPAKGTIRSLFDGRFIMHEYESAIQGSPLRGVMILGYYLGFDRFQMSWVDTFHMGTGILLSQGEGRTGENVFSVLGSYSDPSGGDPWGWRTEFELQDNDHLTITHFNITPAGEEAKAVEVVYTRQI